MDAIRAQAMLQEIEAQRLWALTRCANMAALLAVQQKRILELEATIQKAKKKAPAANGGPSGKAE